MNRPAQTARKAGKILLYAFSTWAALCILFLFAAGAIAVMQGKGSDFWAALTGI